MLTATSELLQNGREGKYAVGAFNIYNLEGALAVVQTAEELRSPVMLQLLPSALELGGRPLVAMCLAMAEEARAEVAVHLDHCSSAKMLAYGLDCGCSSVMADGSALSYEDNVHFTRGIVKLAAEKGKAVEAELGRLSGEEDGITVAEREAQLTDPFQAADFVKRTGVDALAVCIGNIHGRYYHPPRLDFNRLAAIGGQVEVPLVLHGTSGLPDAMITAAIDLGVCKFNVNTEVRSAAMEGLAHYLNQESKRELLAAMHHSIAAMKKPVAEKIRLFRSAGTSRTRA